ncbi:hypothetical protein K0M31_007534 [Melipona bicolor]|uniref:Uncharacterized protein n=1 Tax=Melipona bicolor TaxID=60889 RepID=A0AA40KVR8_9HYME|nr:hypothetical protein K0M31_007534 [Melipona bicolor]
MDAIEIVSRRYERFVHAGGIDFNINGGATQLLSNEVEDVRCSDLPDPANYSSSTPLIGTIESFSGVLKPLRMLNFILVQFIC